MYFEIRNATISTDFLGTYSNSLIMKTIRILSIRKSTDQHILALESDYIKRLKQQVRVELEDIRQTYGADLPLDILLKKEAELYKKRIRADSPLIVLHESGKSLTSPQFSHWLQDQFQIQSQPLTFLIGSAFGIHDELRKKARMVLSLSKMTLSHEHARLILMEQLYRAVDIAKGGKYHK